MPAKKHTPSNILKAPGDPFVAKMDAFADQLLGKAQEDGVGFRDSLDAFKELAGWVKVKKGITDGSGGNESLDELKRKLREADSEIDQRTGGPRPNRSGNSRVKFNTDKGGSALDSIRRRLPGADAGDDAGGGNGAVRSSIGAADSLGSISSSGDGDE